MGQHLFIRRDTMHGDGTQQRGLEPTPVLIRSFQVHLRGAFQLISLIQHTAVGNARIEPDIENIGDLLILCFIHTQTLEYVF